MAIAHEINYTLVPCWYKDNDQWFEGWSIGGNKVVTIRHNSKIHEVLKVFERHGAFTFCDTTFKDPTRIEFVAKSQHELVNCLSDTPGVWFSFDDISCVGYFPDYSDNLIPFRHATKSYIDDNKGGFWLCGFMKKSWDSSIYPEKFIEYRKGDRNNESHTPND